MDDMSGLVLFKQPASCFDIPRSGLSVPAPTITMRRRGEKDSTLDRHPWN